jgi:E3 ubiquitin-protein ligase MARCH6
MLLMGAWITLLAVNSAMVLVPVTLGRGIFSLFSQLPIARGAKCNDLYAFNIGCYVLWATAAAVRYVIDYLRTHNVHVLLMQVLKWSAIVAKSVVLLALWIVVIPVVVGLLFELLVVVPLRVPIDESPVFIFYQDWALGLVFLKIWTRLVMLGQITPLADERWRIRFEQVRTDGFANLRGFWVLKEIIAPILIRLLVALCVPHIFARWIFPSLGYSLIVNSAVNRFAWLGCLGIAVIWYGVKRLRQWLLDLHNSIRDDRYLVGRRLHNFGERKRSGPPATPKIESFPVATRFAGTAIEDVPRLGLPTDQDFPSGLSTPTSAGSSSTGVVEDKSKFTQAESRERLRAAIQEGERIGIAGASLRFRHSAATSSSDTDQ